MNKIYARWFAIRHDPVALECQDSAKKKKKKHRGFGKAEEINVIYPTEAHLQISLILHVSFFPNLYLNFLSIQTMA